MELCNNVSMKKIFLWFLTLSWAAYTFYLTTIPNFKPTQDTILSWVLSNGGHFFFFGVLAVLLSLSLPHKVWRLTSRVYAILITSLYGLFIEFVQLQIPGRSFDLFDWVLDTLGTLFAILILKRIDIHA